MISEECGSGIVLFGVILVVVMYFFGLMIEVNNFKAERARLSEVGKQIAVGVESGEIRGEENLGVMLNNMLLKHDLVGVDYDIRRGYDTKTGEILSLRKDFTFSLFKVFGVGKVPIEVEVCRGSC